MNKMDLVRNHINKMEVMQLATSVYSQPWICTVHFLYVNNRIYWVSAPYARHSGEIQLNPHVAVAMAVQTTPPIIGIQIEGDAAVVKDQAELDSIIPKFAERHNRPVDEVRASLSGHDPRLFYRFTPRTYVTFDKQNYPHDSRQEWPASEFHE